MNNTNIRKEEILVIAQQLFETTGFEKTSISRIAKELNIAKGLVYYYFETKEDILHSVVDRMCNLQLKRLVNRLDVEGTSFYEALLLLVLEYAQFKSNNTVEAGDGLETKLMSEFHHHYRIRIRTIIDRVSEMGLQENVLTIDNPQDMILMVLEGVYRLEYYEHMTIDEKLGLIETALHLEQGCLKSTAKRIIRNRLKEGAVRDAQPN